MTEKTKQAMPAFMNTLNDAVERIEFLEKERVRHQAMIALLRSQKAASFTDEDVKAVQGAMASQTPMSFTDIVKATKMNSATLGQVLFLLIDRSLVEVGHYGKYVAVAPPEEKVSKTAKLLEVLAIDPLGRYRTAQLAEMTGFNEKCIWNLLSRQMEAGTIVRPDRGQYSINLSDMSAIDRVKMVILSKDKISIDEIMKAAGVNRPLAQKYASRLFGDGLVSRPEKGIYGKL